MTGPYFESWEHENLVKFAKEAYAKLQKQEDELQELRRLKNKRSSPPQRQPLTDEEMFEILVGIDAETKRLPPGMKAFARAIERKHGIGGGG
jgi:hypothetical protein